MKAGGIFFLLGDFGKQRRQGGEDGINVTRRHVLTGRTVFYISLLLKGLKIAELLKARGTLDALGGD